MLNVGIPIVMQNVDVSEDMAKEFERLKKCGIMVRAENQQSKVDFINKTISLKILMMIIKTKSF